MKSANRFSFLPAKNDHDFFRPVGWWVLMSIVFINSSFAQSIHSNSSRQDSLKVAELKWIEDMHTHGVTIKDDSVYFNEETRLIATDSIYRNLIYPKSYKWEIVPTLLNRKAVKPAMWYFINLYMADTARQDLIFKTIMPLDQILEMDRVMLATFYTYIAFDPEVYVIENGKTISVRRPDIAEQKLLATKNIVEQILLQRSQSGKKEH